MGWVLWRVMPKADADANERLMLLIAATNNCLHFPYSSCEFYPISQACHQAQYPIYCCSEALLETNARHWYGLQLISCALC